MTSSTFNLSAAKTKAAKKSNDDLVLAAGNASNEFDRIVTAIATDPDLSEAARADKLSAVNNHVGDVITAALSNGQLTLPSSSSGRSVEELEDKIRELEEENRDLESEVDRLKDENDKAEKANANLKKDRTVLEEIVLDLGMTTPTDTSTAFPTDTATRVKSKVQEKVDEAKRTATPSDSVEKSEVKAIVDKMVVIDDSNRTVRGNDVKAPLDETRANNAGIDKLRQLVS